MLNKGLSKSEIERAIEGKGDFMQINFLKNFIEKNHSLPTDVKKFAYEKLAKLYQKKFLLEEAAKAYENIALSAIRYTEKIQYYMKEAEMWIQKGDFDRADKAMRHALNEANATQKKEIYSETKRLYFRQAEKYEKDLKRNHALKIYEKLLHTGLEDDERISVREKLIYLYERLGRIKDAEKMRSLV